MQRLWPQAQHLSNIYVAGEKQDSLKRNWERGMSTGGVVIKTQADEVCSFVDVVRQRADSERTALGFIPHSAYQEAAVQGKLWVAVALKDGLESYVGHLLFGGVFPTLRVFQLFVSCEWRGNRVGTTLIEQLIRHAESFNYLSIRAKVADDLNANAFWDRHGFVIATSQAGGSSRNRVILLRERRLSSPTLFDLLNTSVAPTDHDLRLAERLLVRAPIYTLDVNVVLDLTKQRSRAADVSRIISAALGNSIRLYVAPEFVNELRRSTLADKQDPVLEFAVTLPQFPAPPKSEADRLVLELAATVFPERTKRQRLKLRDYSDLMHLATAIHNRAAGFVTSENAILKRQAIFREKYGLDVIGVTEFAESLTATQWDEQNQRTTHGATGGEIEVGELEEHDRCKARQFLESIKLQVDWIEEVLASGYSSSPRRRLLISFAGQVVCYASWDAPQKVFARIDAHVFAIDTHPIAESALDHVLFLLMKDASHAGPSLIRISSNPGALIRQLAAALGFRAAATTRPSEAECLQKVCLGGVIDESNWEATRRELSRVASVGLPAMAPQYQGPQTPITVLSPQSITLSLPLFELEELLGPVLLLLPNRPATIVPIRLHYAEQLLDTAQQHHLFPKCEASLLFRRAYISSARSLGVLGQGTVLLFYESQKFGGRGAIVACARSTENAINSPDEISSAVKRRGVLEDGPIERIGRSGKTGITYASEQSHG